MKNAAILLLFSFIFLLVPQKAPAGDKDKYYAKRQQMVNEQIIARGIDSPEVIKAMRKVPRHFFIPKAKRHSSYIDSPVPIGEGQTISQPFIVALMTQILEPAPDHRILEIGTGSGYQAAIMAELAAEVYTIEIIESLGKRAEKTLKILGYENIFVKIGDGYKGWPEKAPFDSIIVTCAPEKIPRPLVDQLTNGGRLVLPVGRRGGVQSLMIGIKKGERLETRDVLPVRFVPMIKGD